MVMISDSTHIMEYNMLEFLSFAFMQKALLAGILVSIATSLIGVHLIQRRLSLLGDGIAHAAFGGVAIGFLLSTDPILTALVFAAGAAKAGVDIGRAITPETVYADINKDGYTDREVAYKTLPYIGGKAGEDETVYGQKDGSFKTVEELITAAQQPYRDKHDAKVAKLRRGNARDERRRGALKTWLDRSLQKVEEKVRKRYRDKR